MRVFLFPGQGSQEIGMGADLFEKDSQFSELIALATKLTGVDLRRICLRGPERELVRTEVLQPLLVAVCLGYGVKLLNLGVQPQTVLGHSLGEISALACAGVLDFEDAVRIAAKRGELMAAAAAQYPGGMLAVLSAERVGVLEVLAPLLENHRIFLANDNAPGQLLVSGTTQGIADAASAVTRARVPCKKVPVAGPWHTPFMVQAQQEFRSWLRQMTFRPPRVPVLMNVTGTLETAPETLRELLVRNLTEPVQWRASMACLLSLNPGVLFEVGPGRVLSGLARANGFSDQVRIINVSNRRGLALTVRSAVKDDSGERAVFSREGDGQSRPTVRLATPLDREAIYRIRHDVFAAELHQYATNASGRLVDPLDGYNEYIVISQGPELLGFISITPPGRTYSIDKYLQREQLPFRFDDKLYEVRLMAVPQSHRRTLLALALMYASFRWVEAHGGTRLMAIGRKEIRSMHLRVGLKPVGIDFQAGSVTYGVLQAGMADVHQALPGVRTMLDRIQEEMSWEIGVPFDTPAPCYHGGQFFEAVGDGFETLERFEEVISADVLDAWYPPAPGVLEALQRYLPRLLQTSPPTGCEGLVRAVARARGVAPENILPGGGSSDLIFLALRHWLRPESKVLMLSPTYGEYIHILEKLVRCTVSHLSLHRRNGYRVDTAVLGQRLKERHDLVILVNPNSPTGQHIPRRELETVIAQAPPETRVWVDETYVEYVAGDESLERFAARSRNVIVCKSMSKTYALSGARVGYLCASPHQLEALRSISPPWAVSLPAQVAAVKALADPAYYAERYRETHKCREQLARELRQFGWDPVPSVTNFLLCLLPPSSPDAATIIARCRERGLFLRDTSTMGPELAGGALRIAVKDWATNLRMIEIIRQVLGNGAAAAPFQAATESQVAGGGK